MGAVAGPDAPHIRSFVPRRGRMTSTQADALGRLGDRFVLPESADPIDPAVVFGRRAPLVVEIGFGLGEATAAMAPAEPDTDILAIEVHTPGIGQLLHLLGRDAIGNVRILQADAVEVLRDRIAPASLAGIRIWFPDPWPKYRHHKRRLVRPELVELFADRLADGGTLHLATDWQHYALQARDLLRAQPTLVDTSDGRGFVPRPPWRPVTRFERFAAEKGHDVFDLVFTRRHRDGHRTPA
jgi:tRNA (guanine-N7-)-methyltransferase